MTRTTKITDQAFQEECAKRVEPALLEDIDDMISGRVRWRKVSAVSEVLGKGISIIATILAYSSASELTAGNLSRALAFASGACGTVSVMLVSFSQYARRESLERTRAMNSVLKKVNVQKIPDIMESIDVQGDSR